MAIRALLMATVLEACTCVPHGTSLRVSLVESGGSPVEDAVVSCTTSGGFEERASQVDRGVYECGTGQGRFFLTVDWHGSQVVSQTVDIFGESGNCSSVSAPVGLSFTLTPAAGDGGPAADAALDAGRD